MSKFIIQFILLLAFCIINTKRKNTAISSSNFLVLLYCISAFLAIFCLDIMEYSEPYEDRYWFPMLGFVGTLFLFLIPFCRFDETKIEAIILPRQIILDRFSVTIIILSVYAILYYVQTAARILISGNLGDARNALAFEGVTYVENTIFNTIASVSASFYIFCIFLFFLYTAKGGYNKIRIGLFISSFSYPINVFCYVGRDGVVYWIFSFIFFYLFFYNFISEKDKKNIRSLFIKSAIVLLVPFLLISIGRFDDSDIGTGGSLISYMGQSFVNGPLYFGIENKPYNVGGCFPLFFEVTGTTYTPGQHLNEIGDWKSWYFSTFIVSLYYNLKPFGLYFVAFITFILFNKLFGLRRTVVPFKHLFTYILFFQIYAEGVFYFREYTRGGNLFILICIFLTFLFPNSNKSNILHKL